MRKIEMKGSKAVFLYSLVHKGKGGQGFNRAQLKVIGPVLQDAAVILHGLAQKPQHLEAASLCYAGLEVVGPEFFRVVVAINGDVGILQGDVTGLRERLKVLSGLTARMEQAEETLATFTKEIRALEDETTALTSSLTDLSQDVDTMGEILEAVEAQTEKATTFFERLQQLLQEIFAEQPAEPQSAAPQTVAPDLEVSA